jgi:hypothetical protein
MLHLNVDLVGFDFSGDETVKGWQVEAASGCGVCRQTLAHLGPYAGMKIAGVTGISEAQKAALNALGAVEERTLGVHSETDGQADTA